MADQKDQAPAGAPETQNLPGIQVVTQYVKDCSFENPNAPESLVSGWPAPDTEVQIGLAQNHLQDNLYETSLNFKIQAKNKKDGKMAFIIDLHYGAMVALHNIPAENVQPILMIEVPKLLFPFVREIIGSLTAKGGYPPLYLTPINFEAIYVGEMKRLQDQQKKTGAA